MQNIPVKMCETRHPHVLNCAFFHRRQTHLDCEKEKLALKRSIFRPQVENYERNQAVYLWYLKSVEPKRAQIMGLAPWFVSCQIELMRPLVILTFHIFVKDLLTYQELISALSSILLVYKLWSANLKLDVFNADDILTFFLNKTLNQKCWIHGLTWKFPQVSILKQVGDNNSLRLDLIVPYLKMVWCGDLKDLGDIYINSYFF